MFEPERVRFKRAENLIPILLGLCSFWAITGGRVLNGRNIAWLQGGDQATYFLGWHFFRTTPWGMPPGVSPRYGMEIGSSIAYADNVPLFAFLFKAIGRWLPMPFQYFGIWILLCFVMQAWFAWLLVGLVTRVRLPRALATLLFVVAPPLLNRLEGAYQMCGQWQVLAALYLCFGPRRLARGVAWPLLAYLVALTHFYMTVMVLGLWTADWLRRVLFEGRKVADFVQLAAVPALVLLGFWQIGMFVVGRVLVQHGFGEYKMNLLSLVDPSGWSYVLKDIPEGYGEYEGFNFLGLGGLLLVLFALPATRRAWPWLRAKREYWPLLAVFIGLTLFAISNRVGFADHTLEIPLPASWIERANLVRGSGRMFWPVYYVLLLVCARCLLRSYSSRIATLLLLAIVSIQIVDTSAGWLHHRALLMNSGTTWKSPLRSDFWAQVPSMYRALHTVPVRSMGPHYEDFAYFAGMHDMSTDAVYLARLDTNKRDAATKRAIQTIKSGRYEPAALYVVDRAYEKLARRGARPQRDLVAWIDGFLVVAPNWKCRPQCLAAEDGIADCSTTCAGKTPG
ncbi:MAG TPA: DUF6311 domain-containing protein [Polyangiaceae bacterium]|nr:DUF6311 domain-containing protein [Polyangiaceae bacterium]